MSAENTTVKSAPPAPKPRNPIEKMIVRGFIGLMLLLVVIEAIPWYSHRQALAGLRQRLDAAEQDPESKGVHQEDVKAALGSRQPKTVEDIQGRPDAQGASRREIYTWFTLSPVAKREIYVYYGFSGKNDKLGAEVLDVQPNEQRAAPPKAPVLTPEEQEAMKKAAASAPAMGGPGQGGQRGRGKRQRPAAEETEPKADAAEGTAAKPTDEPNSETPDAPKDDKPGTKPATGDEKPETPAE